MFEVTFECSVCCETDSFSFFNLPEVPLAGSATTCAHDADVCNACHGDYLRSVSRFVTDEASGDVAIPCMARGCTRGVYRVAGLNALLCDDSETHATLLDRMATMRFERMSNARYCTRPACSAPLTFELDDDECTSVVCARCANAMCVACQSDAHDGVSCAEYAARAAAGWTSEKLINAISRCCPRCNFRINRDGGCPHMTCSRCSHEFCFGCLGERGGGWDRTRGDHTNCTAIAMAFEAEGARLLEEMYSAELAERHRALIAAARANGAAVAAHRAQVRADADDDDTSAFDPFAAFSELTEEPRRAPKPDNSVLELAVDTLARVWRTVFWRSAMYQEAHTHFHSVAVSS